MIISDISLNGSFGSADMAWWREHDSTGKTREECRVPEVTSQVLPTTAFRQTCYGLAISHTSLQKFSKPGSPLGHLVVSGIMRDTPRFGTISVGSCCGLWRVAVCIGFRLSPTALGALNPSTNQLSSRHLRIHIRCSACSFMHPCRVAVAHRKSSNPHCQPRCMTTLPTPAASMKCWLAPNLRNVSAPPLLKYLHSSVYKFISTTCHTQNC